MKSICRRIEYLRTICIDELWQNNRYAKYGNAYVANLRIIDNQMIHELINIIENKMKENIKYDDLILIQK